LHPNFGLFCHVRTTLAHIDAHSFKRILDHLTKGFSVHEVNLAHLQQNHTLETHQRQYYLNGRGLAALEIQGCLDKTYFTVYGTAYA
jgi:hypothetical protein